MSVAWRPSLRRWQVAPVHQKSVELAAKLRTSPLIAQVLCNRGIADEAQARAFLNPKLLNLHDPLLLHDAAKAADLIAAAATKGRKIVIYGDYDVDGMTAVAILHACLKMLGANVSYYVPHRLEEGYGLNDQAVEKIVADGAEMIITVDCGISACDAVALAAGRGVDVIVTDHHGVGPSLPPALAVVHPALGEYPNPHLCGAGVAFKLAWQIARSAGGETRVDEPMRKFLLDATCLAALGTIADVVPLVDENRVLALHGLRGLRESQHPGLRALIASADLEGKTLDAFHVGFVLGPRLNACGRMGHAALAVELLTDSPSKRCAEIAAYLNEQNTQRQKVEREIAQQASDEARQCGMDSPDCKVVVLAGESWHGGVIGIVASRLVEQFNKPAVLIAFNGDGLGHGSGRSIPGFDLRAALESCQSHLVSFGGHAMAGGLKIEPSKVKAFAEAMQEYAASHITDEQLAAPLELDAEATVAAVGPAVVSQLDSLAPFGQGNPPPAFAFRRLKVMTEPKRMGRGGKAVQFYAAQGESRIRVVGFAMGDLADSISVGTMIDAAGRPVLNHFNGRTSVELILKDVELL